MIILYIFYASLCIRYNNLIFFLYTIHIIFSFFCCETLPYLYSAYLYIFCSFRSFVYLLCFCVAFQLNQFPILAPKPLQEHGTLKILAIINLIIYDIKC